MRSIHGVIKFEAMRATMFPRNQSKLTAPIATHLSNYMLVCHPPRMQDCIYKSSRDAFFRQS
jgi:hypothetical protein